MNSKLTALNRWLNDQSWEMGTAFSKMRFYECVKAVLIEDPDYTITPQDIEDYIIGQFIDHSEPEKVKAHAKVAAIQFGAIQTFCKINKLSLM